MTGTEALTHLLEQTDDKTLMTQCVLGLCRYAQELEVCQGTEAMEKITALRDLTHEITDFWDLDGALSPAPSKAAQ